MESGWKRLGETISAIGEADFYPSVARYLRQCISYDNIIVIVFHGTDVPTVLYREIHGPDVFRYVEEQYLPAAYLLDPIYQFHLNAGKPGLYRLLEFAPDHFRRSRYYKWYYGRIGIIDEISVVLPVRECTTITISMGKDSSSGQMFSTRSEDNLRQHEPVIMALLESHARASKSPSRGKANVLSITDNLVAAMYDRHGVKLSKRQAEVALLILRGHSSPSIGLHLGISRQTVKVFRKQLSAKCNLCSQAELFAMMMPLLERSQQTSQGQ